LEEKTLTTGGVLQLRTTRLNSRSANIATLFFVCPGS
jgi:hypothetical protein